MNILYRTNSYITQLDFLETLGGIVFLFHNLLLLSFLVFIIMSGCFCLQCVRTQEVAVLEDLGQFKNLLKPGLNITLWPISQLAGRLSLRIQQLDVVCETKTKDNVFVQVGVSGTFCVYFVLLWIAFTFYRRLQHKASHSIIFSRIVTQNPL